MRGCNYTLNVEAAAMNGQVEAGVHCCDHGKHILNILHHFLCCSCGDHTLGFVCKSGIVFHIGLISCCQ